MLDEGSFQTRPAKIRRLLADAIFIQATEGDDDVTMEAGPTLLAMHEGVELLQADVAGLEASMTHKVDEEVFEAAVASLVAADAALTVEVAGKQARLGVGIVQGGHPLLEDGRGHAREGDLDRHSRGGRN